MSQFAITPHIVNLQAGSSQPQEENKGFSFRDLLNPCSLVGRVCENWREIVSIVATVMLVVGFVTSLFVGAFFNAVLFGVSAAIMSLLVREIRDLGTYKKENVRHSDINDDQVIITMNLAARNDELDRTAKLFAEHNQELTGEVKQHQQNNLKQGVLLEEQRQQQVQQREQYELEQKEVSKQVEEQKRQAELVQQQYEQLIKSQATMKLDTNLLLKAISEGTGTFAGTMEKLLITQRKFEVAVKEDSEGAKENTQVMGGHLNVFAQTLEQAQQDSAQLGQVREQFETLMDRQKKQLEPLRELLSELSQNPKVTLQLTAQAQVQLRQISEEHARLQSQVESSRKTVQELNLQIQKSKGVMEKATQNME